MDPGSLAMMSMGSSMAGTGISALGSVMGGQSQQQMYNYQAGIAQINAKIAMQNSDYALKIGEQQADKAGIGDRQRMGAIVAAQGASGIDVNSGSNVAVQKSQEEVAHMDLATIRQGAAKTAYDYRVQATGFENQAALYTMAGDKAMVAGEIGAASSLLSGTASVADKWLQAGQVGLGASSGQNNGSTIALFNGSMGGFG